ncbi:MAG: hypothetical protein KVP17_002321 [Porospora cf. gigantea B]|uniref:uncharacterized protein n=2 Tax=Porospora cf. gigantea B TaxID=2853592 RepID=UPI0035718B3E|nr:MAG: hypothetical protein KVP17_002321 [Porospora cf. gigantea B]
MLAPYAPPQFRDWLGSWRNWSVTRAWGVVDLEYNVAQVVYLFSNPQKLTNFSEFRRHVKGRMSRDDPSFALVLAFFIGMTDLAYTFALGLSWHQTTLSVLWSTGVVFGFGSVVIASVCFYIVNHVSVVRYSAGASGFGWDQAADDHTVTQAEWIYCFDVHCNAIFPGFVIDCVGGYFMLPLLWSADPPRIALILGNLMSGLGWMYYGYIMVLGMSALPFVKRPEIFLVASVFWCLVLVLASLAGVNCMAYEIRGWTGVFMLT